MALPVIKIKVKGMQAVNALNAKGQLLKGLNLKGIAALSRDSTIKLKPAGAFIGNGATPLPGIGKGIGAGNAKAAAIASKGAGSWGWSCLGLGPWGIPLVLGTLGLAALAYYFYRQSHQVTDGLDDEVPAVEGAVPAV